MGIEGLSCVVEVGGEEVAKDLAVTIALLVALAAMEHGGPVPGVAIEMAIGEYIRGFWPLVELHGGEGAQV